jgi:hypothetical protein
MKQKIYGTAKYQIEVISSVLLIFLLITSSSPLISVHSGMVADVITNHDLMDFSKSIPQGIVYEVPIDIYNGQNTSTGDNFQQELIINSTEFAERESPNLQNIEFFYKNGTIIPSWLESGNSRNSTQTIYWLKLVNGVASGSTNIIYMGFAKENEILFNDRLTGEAPRLSPVYGEYDNGANVFVKYWNFKGASIPPGWMTLTNSQPVAVAYYNTNINRPFDVIDEPSGSRLVTGISTGNNQGSIGYAFVFYPGVSYWGDDGTTYGLYSYNNSPELLSSLGPPSFPSQIGVGYNGDTFASLQGAGFTSVNSSLLNFYTENTIFISSDTWGVGGGASISVNNSLVLSVSTGSNGQITTSTNFIALAYFPPDGVMPSTTVDAFGISFNEMGYPSGRQWTLLIDNHTVNSSADEISIVEYPGIYNYSIVPGFGKIPSPSSGKVYVTDSNVTIDIKYESALPVAVAPLTIVNNQDLPTGMYQQFAFINSSRYDKYINGNWSNVEFMYGNDTLIPAWIYGPTSNTSYTPIYLRLFSIPATSTITIYMVFLQENISILSEYGPTGEGYFQGNYLTDEYSPWDNGNEVFTIYAIFDAPTLPSLWFLKGSAQFFPNEGVETVNGNGNEMGAVVLDENLPSKNITIFVDSYYQGSADQQNFGIFAEDPSGGTGDNGGIGEIGYTFGFNPYYGLSKLYYNGTSISSAGFWRGGTSYLSTTVSINNSSILCSVYQTSSNGQFNVFYLNYTSTIRKDGGLFFSSSTGGSSSVQILYDLEVVYSPPNNFMPSVIYGNASAKKIEISFVENGLPKGTQWFVNISGQIALSSLKQIINVSLFNGTYHYTVSCGREEFEPSTPSGNFTVNGTPVIEQIVFSRLFFVNFSESGLPQRTSWYINISGRPSFSSVNSTISIILPNGSYAYSVGSSDNRYFAKGGSFSISGLNISESVDFTEITYNVTFKEIGLPLGTKWYLNITAISTLQSDNSLIFTSLSNGTYHYSIEARTPYFAPASSTGTFTVNGSSISENIIFYKAYIITFEEKSLPSYTNWYVNISGQPVIKSNTTSASISLPNGSYYFSVGTGNNSYKSAGGSFVVSGKNISLSIEFTMIVYNISLLETGLPIGDEWYFNITGQTPLSTTSNSIHIELPNGTYSYNVGTKDREYKSTTPSGSFNVGGTSYNLYVNFSEVTYKVSFSESGLTAGIWYVNISNNSVSFNEPFTTEVISFDEPNGTYQFTVTTNTDLYSAKITSGYITVNGMNVSKSVEFLRTFPVNLTVLGGSLFENLEVVIENRTYQSSTTSLKLFLPNGDYHYSAYLKLTHGNAYVSSGNFVINSSKVNINLIFPSYYVDIAWTFLIPFVLFILFFVGSLILRKLK